MPIAAPTTAPTGTPRSTATTRATEPRSAALVALVNQARADTLRLIAAVLQQPAAARALRAATWAPPDPANPAIRFDLRGQAAGQFRIEQGNRCTIRYNPTLLARHGQDFLRRTVPHETAHYLAFLLHGHKLRPHGPQWQALMHSLGAEPSRCHQYDVSDLKARTLTRHDYHCACRDHELTSIRHRRIQAGTAYLCRTCGEPLRPGRREAKRRAPAGGDPASR